MNTDFLKTNPIFLERLKKPPAGVHWRLAPVGADLCALPEGGRFFVFFYVFIFHFSWVSVLFIFLF